MGYVFHEYLILFFEMNFMLPLKLQIVLFQFDLYLQFFSWVL